MNSAEQAVAHYSRFNSVQKPDLRVLHCLAIVATKYGRRYCYPSQETILNLLRRFHGRRMSRRTLQRHLNALCDQWYLRRRRRHCRGHGGRLELHSTLYLVGGRAWRSLVGLRNAVASACGYPGGALLSRSDTNGTISHSRASSTGAMMPLRC